MVNEPPESLSEHDPKVISNRYTIISRLGAGGMGRVYLAQDQILDRKVAIKVLLANDFNDHHISRFQQEARAVSKLNHPGIVTALDFGVTDNREPFLVMEYKSGETLDDVLKKRGRLELDDAFAIVAQIADAINHAHSRGVIHRDLKPSNIMVIESDNGSLNAHVFDFGIAKIVQDSLSHFKTKTGLVIGSPSCISPEQARGAALDGRSDIYSLGCVMFEAITGSPPFCGDTAMETIQLHLAVPPPTLSEKNGITYSSDIEKVMAKALAKNADDRYQTMTELSQALEAAVAAEGFDDQQLPVTESKTDQPEKKNEVVPSNSNPLAWRISLAMIGLVAGLLVFARTGVREATEKSIGVGVPDPKPEQKREFEHFMSFSGKGEPEVVLQNFNAALVLPSVSPPASIADPLLDQFDILPKGDQHRKNGQLQMAQTVYDRILDTAIKSKPPRVIRSDLIFRAATSRLLLQIQLNNNRGLKTHDDAATRECFDRALNAELEMEKSGDLKVGYIHIINQLALCCSVANRKKDFARLVNFMLAWHERKDPSSVIAAVVYNYKALILREQKKFKEADSYYARAYEICTTKGRSDDLASTMIQRADSLMAWGKTPQAVALYKSALNEIDPKNKTFRGNCMSQLEAAEQLLKNDKAATGSDKFEDDVDHTTDRDLDRYAVAGRSLLKQHSQVDSTSPKRALENFYGDADVKAMRAKDTIDSLSLRESNVTDKCLEYLVDCSKLKNLNLQSTKVSSLTSLSKLKSLETLDLSATSVGDSSLKEVGALPRLGRLLLNKTNVTDDGLIHLQSMKSLEFLDLSHSALSENCGAKVGQIQYLKELKLHSPAITLMTIKEIAAMPSLQKLDVAKNKFVSDSELNNLSEVFPFVALGQRKPGIQLMLLRADKFAVQGDYASAFDRAQQCLRLMERRFGAKSPQLVPALVRIANFATSLKKTELAIQLLNRAAEMPVVPENAADMATIFDALSVFCDRTKDRAKAIKYTKKAIDAASLAGQIDEPQFNRHTRLSEYYIASGNHSEAHRLVEKANALAKQMTPVNLRLARFCLVRMGEVLRAEKRYSEANNFYDRYLKAMNPSSIDDSEKLLAISALLGKAEIANTNGKLEQALMVNDRAMRMGEAYKKAFPHQWAIYQQRTRLLTALGRTSEAAACAKLANSFAAQM
ncbi:MAG: protein kinase [Candidatus Melainabacteria bacterium]|nr:protein kinase [Candidatus Melainabacteria bacterium]